MGENVLKRTPLYNIHKALGARIVEFAGWEMPVEYSGIMEEHLTVREAVGLFDISHMGEIEVSGVKALEAVKLITTNDASRLTDGQVQYTILCYPDGGIVDDVTLYRLNEKGYMLCVNAVNTNKVFKWVKEKVGNMVEVRDRSDDFALLALQGPLSEGVLQNTCNIDLSSIRYYHFSFGRIDGVDAIISRTGYTGEDGFEIFIPPTYTEKVWDMLLKTGKGHGIKPIGLGARDTLRLEMGYPLYSHELTQDTTPLEAGLDRFVNLQKPFFIGKEALEGQKKKGVEKRLVGFEMLGRGIPRAHYPIYTKDRQVGEVTSGTHSPSLDKAIGMGYVETSLASPGEEIGIKIRDRLVKARIVRRPFAKTHQKK
ncbi:MAG: glycine cleavage system aminomethyltransferase GcvT [Deltaproteobacteria bacterium]|nr:glycine cleavage system aminomethyltransferase GcvT [Deltaproteobacteria bacterium]